MTHNSCHEITSDEFCDWMEVNVEVKKKGKSCTSPLRVEARSIRPSSTERVAGWICIHGVGPWENVSLGCIVSHIRSHLENHLPTSLCSSSLSPPLALPVHSRTNTQKTHPQTSFIPRLSNCPNYTHTRSGLATHTHFLWENLLLNHWPFGCWRISQSHQWMNVRLGGVVSTGHDPQLVLKPSCQQTSTIRPRVKHRTPNIAHHHLHYQK